MVGKNHLGNTEELILFVKDMNQQLQKHQDEKHSMRKWTFAKSMNNNIPEIIKRIRTIESIFYELEHELLTSEQRECKHKEIKKQFIHIANYSMMGWIKASHLDINVKSEKNE